MRSLLYSIRSGVADVRHMLNLKMKVGLGTGKLIGTYIHTDRFYCVATLWRAPPPYMNILSMNIIKHIVKCIFGTVTL